MRHAARAEMPRLRGAESGGRALLRFMREPNGPGRFVPRLGFGWALGRAAVRQRPLRRSRGLHELLRGPRPGTGAHPPESIFRERQRGDHPPRRHSREVHRRCGHGGVGHADRPRGRRPTRRSCGSRGRRGGARPWPRPRREGRRRYGRGRGHRRCHEPGDGGRQHGEHGVAAAEFRGRRRGVGGPEHGAGCIGDDRLRACGQPPAQGQGGTDARLARGPRPRRPFARGTRPAAVRRSRRPSSSHKGAAPRGG